MTNSNIVWYSKSINSVVTYPVNNKCPYSGKTFAEIKLKYDDLEVISKDEAIARINQAFTTQPREIDEDTYMEALEVLPPLGYQQLGDTESFKSCEPLTGTITAIYCRANDRYFTFSDSMSMKHDEILVKLYNSEVFGGLRS